MNKLFLSFLFFLIMPTNLVFSEEYSDTNASLITVGNSNCGDGYYHLIVPNDKKKYPYITRDPQAFFFFVNNWNTEKIKNLGTEYISGGFLEECAVPFRNIAGVKSFKDNLNKFELASIKNAITNELLAALDIYKQEYEVYLKDTFTFLNCPINQKSEYYQSNPEECNFKLFPENYNVDKQDLTVNRYGTQVSIGPRHVKWEDKYEAETNDFRYTHNQPRISEEIDIHDFPIDKAKDLFSGNNAYEYTTIKVKPLRGWLPKSPGNWREASVAFSIVNINKYYYKQSTSNGLLTFVYSINIQPPNLKGI